MKFMQPKLPALSLRVRNKVLARRRGIAQLPLLLLLARVLPILLLLAVRVALLLLCFRHVRCRIR